MKELIATIGGIILVIYLIGTFILGAGADSMKSQGKTVNDHNNTVMTQMSTW